MQQNLYTILKKLKFTNDSILNLLRIFSHSHIFALPSRHYIYFYSQVHLIKFNAALSLLDLLRMHNAILSKNYIERNFIDDHSNLLIYELMDITKIIE